RGGIAPHPALGQRHLRAERGLGRGGGGGVHPVVRDEFDVVGGGEWRGPGTGDRGPGGRSRCLSGCCGIWRRWSGSIRGIRRGGSGRVGFSSTSASSCRGFVA